ncbi:MAG: 6-carboxytetrahydropterin synthase [Alphaproteobacteria bacterium]|nr:6-carboxytetrahydropterin synthase [Alphaproteobacteria bacterium]
MHYVSREIGIDAAHREHQHGSKCFNIHGHRYKIQAVCSGGLATDGEQADMVVDFSFLKEAMMRQIDSFCDHGSIFSLDDPNIGSYVHGTLLEDVAKELLEAKNCLRQKGKTSSLNEILTNGSLDKNSLLDMFNKQGFLSCNERGPTFGKLYLIGPSPTAEALAEHWFKKLSPSVEELSNKRAKLSNMVVSETPNCVASYPLPM